jgi:GGDEF domain-containing protein
MSTTPHVADPSGPSTPDDLRHWIDHDLEAPVEQKARLLSAVGDVLDRERRLSQESRTEAIQALSTAFADKLGRLRDEIIRREATVANITRYFEEVVAELSEKAHRDPKTRLLNFEWFMERIESFLAVEQRVRWCALGVVDLTGFKWVNDTLGHAVGDRIIARVARILSEHLRAQDLLTQDLGGNRPAPLRELHARFGGDEFAFFLPALSKPEDARTIAARFKARLEGYGWHQEHLALVRHPVLVDVGVVCAQLGSLRDRRGATHALAEELVQWADRLMYEAKKSGATSVEVAAASIEQGHLRPLPISELQRAPVMQSLVRRA